MEEKKLNYDARWRAKNRHKIKATNSRLREYQKEWKQKNKYKIKITDAAYYQKNKHKDKLRREVYYYLRNKFLAEHPCCDNCKGCVDLEIHHKNYDNNNPENLIVLCRDCHISKYHTQ